jgi:hypothetical protein
LVALLATNAVERSAAEINVVPEAEQKFRAPSFRLLSGERVGNLSSHPVPFIQEHRWSRFLRPTQSKDLRLK